MSSTGHNRLHPTKLFQWLNNLSPISKKINNKLLLFLGSGDGTPSEMCTSHATVYLRSWKSSRLTCSSMNADQIEADLENISQAIHSSAVPHIGRFTDYAF